MRSASVSMANLQNERVVASDYFGEGWGRPLHLRRVGPLVCDDYSLQGGIVSDVPYQLPCCINAHEREIIHLQYWTPLPSPPEATASKLGLA